MLAQNYWELGIHPWYIYIYIYDVYEPRLDVAVVILFWHSKGKKENNISYMTFWSADLLAWLQLIPWLLVPVLFLKNASAVTCCRWARRLRVLQLVWFSMLWTLRSLSDRSREAAAEVAHSPRAGGWSYSSEHSRWEFPQPREAVPQGQVFRCFGVHWAAIWHSLNKRRERVELV